MPGSVYAVSFQGGEAAAVNHCQSGLAVFLGSGLDSIKGEQSLGAALGWVCVNRPTDVTCLITGEGQAVSFSPPPSLVPVAVGNGSSGARNPGECVEVLSHPVCKERELGSYAP